MINITDKNSLLSTAQRKLLQRCASIPFNIGKFTSLDDILTKLNVKVIIEPEVPVRTVPDYLDEAFNFWREEINRLHDQESKDYKRIQEACDNLDRIGAEKDCFSQMPLRGLYDPKKKVIKLFPNEMRQEYRGKRMNELLVSTLAHETMHAYFDRPYHRSYPYVHFVEEPLAEFGMLLYLKDAGSRYYRWAFNDVKNQNTCYRFGVNLMRKYSREGVPYPTRQYLEAYKILIDRFAMPSISRNGSITMPQSNGSPIVFNGRRVSAQWHDVFKCPPRYFIDKSTKTLGLDGVWCIEPIRHRGDRDFDILFDIHISDIDKIYLGDDFFFEDHCHIEYYFGKQPIIVSSKNKTFTAKNGKAIDGSIIEGIPLYKRDMSPALSGWGNKYYELSRNGKTGVIDAQLNQIIPFKYDYVWGPDVNDLFMVRRDGKYGLINLKGEEQVHLLYDDIDENKDGTYTIKQNGKSFIIDKFGNRKK
jgi:hypothetical protein